MFKSLRMRLQFWYGLLLAVVITSFAIVLYVQQRRPRIAEIDTRLAATQQFLVGRLRAAPPETLAAMLAMAAHGEPAQLEGEPAQLEREPAQLEGKPDRGDWPVREMPRSGRFRRPADRAAADRAAVRLMQELQVLRMFRHERPPERPTEFPYFSLWRSDGMLVTRSAPHPPHEFPGLPQARTRDAPPRDADAGDADAGAGAGDAPPRGRFAPRDQAFSRSSLRRGGPDSRPGNVWIVDRDGCREAVGPGPQGTIVLVGRRIDRELRELRALLLLLIGTGTGVFGVGLLGGWIVAGRAIEPIRHMTERISSLVESLLTLARLDGASQPLARANIDVGILVERCVATAEPIAWAKQIRIEAVSEEVFASVDALQIEQVVTNLLSNAIRYSGEGSVVSVHCEASTDQVCVTVSDEGIGISERDLPRIFDRFYRVDQGRSRDAGGSGLGLAISQRIVEDHGGTLVAESQLGRGSTFRLSLPRGSFSIASGRALRG